MNINFGDYFGKEFSGVPASFIEDYNLSNRIYNGKVRDVFDLDDKLLITTSDRISAFDRVLNTVPCKGELLNRIALFWFDNTKDIVENHIIEKVSARSILVKKCEVLPVEVIVRAYITGSAWRDYQEGKDISGIRLPEGLKENQKFDKPIITPSTKAEIGEHDMPISCEEIVSQGLVEEKLWKEIEKVSLALFQRGTEIAAKNGLLLVDTKYEFGLLDGRLVVVDEIHTPDSSRFWFADSYETLFNEGKAQKKVDKEYLRQWLLAKGFKGDGEAPEIPKDVIKKVVEKYISAFETITGMEFQPESVSLQEELSLISNYLK